MSFVVDLGVGELLQLHAECRATSDVAACVSETVDLANQLSGEPFSVSAPVTSLSGGQSRALMIADVAVLGRSPIVLVDEIENAGIDRWRALEALISRDKIVLLATHDPLLALLAPRRVVLRNGGIHAVIDRDERERSLLRELEALEQRFLRARSRLRAGRRATDEDDD
jgi:ABC-type lipoprotein export system ATPase subunit